MSDLVKRLREEGAYMNPGAHLLHEAANELERKDAVIDELAAACKEFVRKCDCGEARSVPSYAQMKAAIAKAES